MAVNEQIVTGRKFRKLVDEATKLWQRISFWTKASDVEFDDGSTAETKMGAINGITDSLASTSSNIAASAKALSQLNNNLMSRPEWIIDENGKITGYKTQGGADTVFPFINEGKIIDVVTQSSNAFDLSAYDNYRYLVFSANSIPFTVDNNCIYMPSAIICDKNLKFVISAQTTATVKKTNSIYTYSAGSNYKICVLIE